MKINIKNAAFAVGICVFGMAGAQAGSAATPEPQIAVAYGDLDLSDQSGARVLLARLNMAASQVCGGKPDIRDLDRVALYRSCTREAVANAVATVGSPMLTSLYGNAYSRMASSR